MTEAALSAQRAPLDIETLHKKAQGIKPSLGRGLRVVLTQTGWTELDASAVRRAQEECTRLGEAHVSLVQNDPNFHIEALRNTPRTMVTCTPNNGFAAACNSGAYTEGPNFEWLLFTQSDVAWSALDVEHALAVVQALGRPYAAVGPSGGYIIEPSLGVLKEVGRNHGVHQQVLDPIVPVDWLAGFWILVHRSVFRKIGGWDEGYFLYYEDPDLCLRLALKESRSLVLPLLQIGHRRGSTIKKRFALVTFHWFQSRSRKRFISKWGNR